MRDLPSLTWAARRHTYYNCAGIVLLADIPICHNLSAHPTYATEDATRSDKKSSWPEPWGIAQLRLFSDIVQVATVETRGHFWLSPPAGFGSSEATRTSSAGHCGVQG